MFTNIKKSLAGVQNKLTVKVADRVGNVIEQAACGHREIIDVLNKGNA